MNKALMIAMQPQHAVNILNGKKTLELRTWIPKGYVGGAYVYVALPKGIKDIIVWHPYHCKWVLWGDVMYDDDMANWNPKNLTRLNGKVAFRFWFDEYDEMEYVSGHYEVNPHDIPLKLCLDIKQINDYGKGKTLYTWHINKLEVFDEPKQLSEFYKRIDGLNENGEFMLSSLIYGGTATIPELRKKYLLSKAPQKMAWVYTKELEK